MYLFSKQNELDQLDENGESTKLFLREWLDRYVEEEALFDSKLVFCEVKLQELLKITAHLPQPNPFRTWICSDLLVKITSAFTHGHTKQVISKLIGVLLSAIYTDQETEMGLMPYFVKARNLNHDLAAISLEHSKAVKEMEAVQLKWEAVLRQWHPAINRTLTNWSRPILALTFLYWKQWVYYRKRRFSEASTASAITGRVRSSSTTSSSSADDVEENENTHQARSFSERVRVLRARYDLRNICGLAFAAWREIAVKNRIKKMREERLRLEDANQVALAKTRKIRRVKFNLKDQLEAIDKELDFVIRKERMLRSNANELEKEVMELSKNRNESKKMINSFCAMHRMMTSALEQTFYHLHSFNLQDPSDFLDWMAQTKMEREWRAAFSKDKNSNGHKSSPNRMRNGSFPGKSFDDGKTGFGKSLKAKEKRKLKRSHRRKKGRGGGDTASSSLNTKDDPRIDPEFLSCWLEYQLTFSHFVQKLPRVPKQLSKAAALGMDTRENVYKAMEEQKASSLSSPSLSRKLPGADYEEFTYSHLLATLRNRSLHQHPVNAPQISQAKHKGEFALKLPDRFYQAKEASINVVSKMSNQAAQSSDPLSGASNENGAEDTDNIGRSTSDSDKSIGKSNNDKENMDTDILSALGVIGTPLLQHRRLVHKQDSEYKRTGNHSHIQHNKHSLDLFPESENPLVSLTDVSELDLISDTRDVELHPFIQEALQLMKKKHQNQIKQNKFHQKRLIDRNNKTGSNNSANTSDDTSNFTSTLAASGSPQKPASSSSPKKQLNSKRHKRFDRLVDYAELDKDMDDATIAWLANSFPALPTTYDDLQMIMQELKELNSTYARDPSKITHHRQMQRMVENVKQLQTKLQQRRDDALERDHVWNDLVFRAEKDVCHRLLQRIRAAATSQDMQADVGVRSTIKRYTRIRRPILLLTRNPDPPPDLRDLTHTDPRAEVDNNDVNTDDHSANENAGSPPSSPSKKDTVKGVKNNTSPRKKKSKKRKKKMEVEGKVSPEEQKGQKEEGEEEGGKGDGNDTKDGGKDQAVQGNGGESKADGNDSKWNKSIDLSATHLPLTDPWHPLNPEPLGEVNEAVLYTTPSQDAEIEKCERVIGKCYVELRKLFRDSCLYSKTHMTRKPRADIQMTHLQFAQLVRRTRIPSVHCVMTTIETMWSQKIAEKKRLWDEMNSVSVSNDSQFQAVIEFDDFLEILLRIAHSKYRTTSLLSQRLVALFRKHLFVPKSRKFDDSHEFRQQIAASSAEFIFERHDKWLHNIFLAYSEVMHANDLQAQYITLPKFKEFVADTGMLSKGQIGVKSVRAIFVNVHVEDMDADRLDSLGDNYGQDFKMVYWEFLESIAALSCFVCKSPYLPLESKIDEFVNIIMTCSTIDRKRHVYNMFYKTGRKLVVE